MTQPPLKTSEGDVCPYKKVSDYKCYPFNELNNITKDGSGNEVVVPLADAMKDPLKGNQGQGSDWTSTILYVVVPIILLIGLIAVIGITLLFTNQLSNPGLPVSASAGAKELNTKVMAAMKATK
jgi:hypothetical protein